MTSPLPGSLGSGVPPDNDPIVQLARQVNDLRAMVMALAAANSNGMAIQSVYCATSGSTFPNDNAWHDYGLTDGTGGASGPLICPSNCTTLTWFLWATSGTSFSTGQTGLLEVQIGAGVLSNGSDQAGTGPYVANNTGTATGQALTSQVTWAGSASGYTAGHTIYLSVFALAAGVSNTGSSGINLNGVGFWTA